MRSIYIFIGTIHAGFGKQEMESDGYGAEIQHPHISCLAGWIYRELRVSPRYGMLQALELQSR